MLRRLILLSSVALLAGAALHGQTVTEENLLAVKKRGASDETLTKAIGLARRIDVDTSFENIPALMEKGLSQAVIDALVRRKEQLEKDSASVSVPPKPPQAPAAPNPPQSTGSCPQDEGVYFLSSSGWQKVERAPLNELSQNYFRVGNPFGRKTVGFKLDGPEAPTKVALRPEFCIVSNTEIPVRGVMIVELAKRGNNREMVTSSSGIFRRTKVGEYDKLAGIQVERVSPREITVKFASDIKAGEYAVNNGLGMIYDFSARGAQNTAQRSSTKLLIAGTGTEPHINTVMDGLVDYLTAAGVAVKLLEGEAKSRTAAVEALKASQADSLVYVTVDVTVGQKDRMQVQCFDKDGKQLWEEDGSGGMAFSATASAKNMLKDITKKLDKHIGHAGLPKS